MPVSDPENRPALRSALQRILRPGMRIIEGGIGRGDIGGLVRMIQRQLGIDQIDLIGVEIFEPYLSMGQERIYDQIILGSVLDILADIPTGALGLVLLIDVLEHFERAQGERLLAEARRAAQHVLVSCPIIDYQQGPMFGNQYEAHLTQWKAGELGRLGYRALFTGKIIGVFECS